MSIAEDSVAEPRQGEVSQSHSHSHRGFTPVSRMHAGSKTVYTVSFLYAFTQHRAKATV